MKIHKVINNINQKSKPKFNMMTKSPLRKQIIILMSTNNTERIMVQSNSYIANLNRLLKEVKSKILADYIYSNNKGIVITTNKIAASSNLNIVEKYMKELNNINSNDIMSSRLL